MSPLQQIKHRLSTVRFTIYNVFYVCISMVTLAHVTRYVGRNEKDAA